MTIAEKKDVAWLIIDHGEQVRALNVACYANAVKALIAIFQSNKGQELPRIWGVDFPEMNNDHHVYLVYQGKVYNRWITWPDDKYPEFDLDELVKRGRDVTTQALGWAIEEAVRLENRGALKGVNLIEMLGHLTVAFHVSEGKTLSEAVRLLG